MRQSPSLTETPRASSGGAPARARPSGLRAALPSAAELVGVFALCAGVCLLAFWPQLSHAAYYRDDWGFAQFYLAHPHGFLTAALHDTLRINRPIYWGYEHAAFGVFGLDPTPQELLALVLAVLYSMLAFVFLRLVGLHRAPAIAVAVLLIAFPLSNSTRLLPSTGTTTLGVIFFLAGAVVSLAALRSGTQRRSVDVSARLLYCLSLLAYQSATALIFLSVLIYGLAVERESALRRWRGDLILVGSFYVVFTALNYAFGDQIVAVAPLSTWVSHGARIAAEAGGVLGLAALPQGRALVTRSIAVERAVAIVIVAAFVIGLSVRAARSAQDTERRETAGHWMKVIGACVVAIALTYLPFLPADYVGYHPLARGQGNRINHVSAIPMLLIVYGLLALAVNLVPARGRAWIRAKPHLPALLAVCLLGAYVVTDRGDITRWQTTAANQRSMVAMLREHLPPGNRPLTVAVVGPLDLINADVPHTTDNIAIDLEGTFSVPLRRLNVRGYLIGPATPVQCGPVSMAPLGNSANRSPYGATAFLFPVSNTYAPVPDQAACERLAPKLMT